LASARPGKGRDDFLTAPDPDPDPDPDNELLRDPIEGLGGGTDRVDCRSTEVLLNLLISSCVISIAVGEVYEIPLSGGVV
jgi:hypothetical protein